MKIFILIYDIVYHSLFTYDKSCMKIFILIYVADIIVTGTSLPFILYLINCLKGDFSLKDLGPLHYLLKIKVDRNASNLYLSQTKYIVDVLHRCKMTGAKPSATYFFDKHPVLHIDAQSRILLPYDIDAHNRILIQHDIDAHNRINTECVDFFSFLS